MALGPLDDLPQGRFWGLAVDGVVVALADAIVHHGEVVTIQQVYCLPEVRRRGYTGALVAAVLEQPTVADCVATWLCAEDNVASRRLAAAVGFGEAEVLGCVTRGGGSD